MSTHFPVLGKEVNILGFVLSKFSVLWKCFQILKSWCSLRVFVVKQFYVLSIRLVMYCTIVQNCMSIPARFFLFILVIWIHVLERAYRTRAVMCCRSSVCILEDIPWTGGWRSNMKTELKVNTPANPKCHVLCCFFPCLTSFVLSP